jgi:hypothetical protein
VVFIIYLKLENKDEFNKKRLIVDKGLIKFIDFNKGI